MIKWRNKGIESAATSATAIAKGEGPSVCDSQLCGCDQGIVIGRKDGEKLGVSTGILGLRWRYFRTPY